MPTDSGFTGHVARSSSAMDEVLLRVRDLSLRRENRDLLYRMNLDVRRGEVHGLLGLNGSGKSTLAYALMGCDGYAPDAGRVTFEGDDITHASITERARLGITLAWQEPARFEGLPVGAYVAIGMGSADRARVVDALQAVSMAPESYLNRAVDRTLSGGERKRVELASVFTMRPRLAILDEPDSGIDMLSLADIGRLVRRMADGGTAVLLISHRDELVAGADAVSLMCRGSNVFTGTPDDAVDVYRRRCSAHAEALGLPPWPPATTTGGVMQS
jgi:Fe-S cluster assembly ATP-binding protein